MLTAFITPMTCGGWYNSTLTRITTTRGLSQSIVKDRMEVNK